MVAARPNYLAEQRVPLPRHVPAPGRDARTGPTLIPDATLDDIARCSIDGWRWSSATPTRRSRSAGAGRSAGADQLVFGIGPATLEETLEMIRLMGEHVIPKIDTDPVHRTTASGRPPPRRRELVVRRPHSAARPMGTSTTRALQMLPESLGLRVVANRGGDTLTEQSLHDEVESAQVGKLVALDRELRRFRQEFTKSVDREIRVQPVERIVGTRPQPDVRIPALVSRPRPAHRPQRHAVGRTLEPSWRPGRKRLAASGTRRRGGGRWVDHGARAVGEDDRVLDDVHGHERGPVHPELGLGRRAAWW